MSQLRFIFDIMLACHVTLEQLFLLFLDTLAYLVAVKKKAIDVHTLTNFNQ